MLTATEEACEVVGEACAVAVVNAIVKAGADPIVQIEAERVAVDKRRKLGPLHGLLLIDKPKGWTSHDVVGYTRKTLGMRSVGHCGTLDPAATGLLVLLLGEATKLSAYLLEQDKRYTASVRLGVTTTTDDLDGEVLSEIAVDLESDIIQNAVLEAQGKLELQVPSYSAIKVNGERLYKKARRGEVFETPLRIMNFYQVNILSVQHNEFLVDVSCTKGSYIRSWVREIGRRLGVGATLAGLRRTASTPFLLANGTSVEELARNVVEGELPKGFIPMSQALPHWRAVRALGLDERLLRNGQISKGLKADLIRSFIPDKEEGVQVLSSQGDLVALIGLEKGRGFVIRRVFQY